MLVLSLTKSLAQLTPSTSEAKVAHDSPDGSILAGQSRATMPSPDEQVSMEPSNYYYLFLSTRLPASQRVSMTVVLGMGF